MGKFISVDQINPSENTLKLAQEALERGEVVVLPTDSVYGIACAAAQGNPAHPRIFEIKGRDPSQTLPLLVAEEDALTRYGQNVPAWAQELASKHWPGALTLVVQASAEVPEQYQAANGTVALRMPDSPLVLELIRRLDVPLATTSANIHGAPAAASASGLDARVVSQADLTLDSGAAPIGIASTVVDCTGDTPHVLREGAVTI